MVLSERNETFILVGLTSVFILLTIGLGINWLTGHEAQRFLILMILGEIGHGHAIKEIKNENYARPKGVYRGNVAFHRG